MITLKINIDKVDKSKFFKGEKGRWLNLVLWETPDSKFGDYMVKQEATKEERDSKAQLPILGNAKIIERKGGNGGGKSKGDDNEDW